MLTHHNIHSFSALASIGRSTDQHVLSDTLANDARYNTSQQHSAASSPSDRLLPMNIQTSGPYFTDANANHHHHHHHHHHHLGHQPPLPHPITISSTAKTNTEPNQYPSPLSSSFPMTNVSLSSPASFASPTSLRYDIVLEAPPAAAQRTEDSPLTYLNKSQFYIINLADLDNFDGVVTSTLTLMFHDESHRRLSGNYWRFWFGQQKDPQSSRAIDINAAGCSGIQNVQYDKFDRVTFDWNGRSGAVIHVRFNCLSTDFSRIKGVKGIPLRLHMESCQAYNALSVSTLSGNHNHRQQQQTTEAAYCKIKLFRDKGAERKNKDDARQLERQMEKLRGKHGEAHALWLTYHRTQPFTVFSEIPECISPQVPIIQRSSPIVKFASVPSGSSIPLHDHSIVSTTSAGNIPAVTIPSTTVNAPLTPPRGAKRSATTVFQQENYFDRPSTQGLLMADIDPFYVPFTQRRAAKRSFFARLPSSEFYRAIYLEELSVKELIAKVGSKIALDSPIQNVVREVPRKNHSSMISVSVDDAVVQEIPEEQDMDIETKADKDGMLTLVLRY